MKTYLRGDKVIVVKWKKLIYFILGFYLYSTSTVYAFDANNCDIRKLELTQMQKARLRIIRMQYKRNATSNLQHIANNTLKNNHLNQILMQSKFNEAEAKHYVLNHYIPRMRQDVQELKVQHEFLQILNIQQRRNWINNCLQ